MLCSQTKLTYHSAPLPPRVQTLQKASVLRSKPSCRIYLLPMCLRELHLQEGKQLSWTPFLPYFTHGSYDLLGEGGLSVHLCKDLSVSFPRTTSDLDGSTKGQSLSKVCNKPSAHMKTVTWTRAHIEITDTPQSLPSCPSSTKWIFLKMWFGALHSSCPGLR